MLEGTDELFGMLDVAIPGPVVLVVLECFDVMAVIKLVQRKIRVFYVIYYYYLIIVTNLVERNIVAYSMNFVFRLL